MMRPVTSPICVHVVMPGTLHEGVFDMGNRRFENSDKLVAAEIRRRVMIAAYPGRPGESVKAAIRRAAHRLSLPFSRTRALWYGLARVIKASEADHVRAITANMVEVEQLTADIAKLLEKDAPNERQMALALETPAVGARRPSDATSEAAD